MLKFLLNQKTSKLDVAMAAGAAVFAAWKALDTYKDYKSDENQENKK